MLKLFVLGILFAFLLCWKPPSVKVGSDSNNFADDSVEYIRQVRDFLSHARIETRRDVINILESIPTLLDSGDRDCWREIFSDTSYFSKRTIENIWRESFRMRIKKWPPDISAGIRVISSDTIKSIFNDRSRGWAYFYKNIGRSINRFSLPIFFNKKYCFFYSGNICGGLSGEGSWKLYRKDGEFWFVVKSYCNWVS